MSGPALDPICVECPICVDHLTDPLSLQCGHAYCRLCLLQSTRLAPDGRSCPLCRQRIAIRDLTTHPVNAGLEAEVKAAVGAAAYEARASANARAIAAFLADSITALPIFAMHPGTRVGAPVALHFFEPRFKILIRRAWEGNRLFVFTAHSPRPGVEGVLVRVDHARFLPDGRATILGVGIEAVRLGEIWVEEGTGGLHCTRIPIASVIAASDMPPLPRVSRGPSNSDGHSLGSAITMRGCILM